MTFGPFDLSDEDTADISFWLWNVIESINDYLIVEVSTSSNQFTELGR